MRENCKSSTQPHSSCSLRGAGGALSLPYPSPCSTVVFSPGGGLSGSRPPGPIAGTILAQRAELGSALRRLVHVSAHCWLGRVRDRAVCCLPTCCFPWKSKPEDLTHVQGLGAVCSALWCQRVHDVLQGRACVPCPYSTPPCHVSSSDVFPFFF